MTQTRVNLLTAVNAASVEIDRLNLDDEPYIAIRNVMWMTDDIVMNDGLYPKSENEKGYASMDGRIMPFGHPQVAGQYVVISNLDNKAAATALAKYYGGVHAENVRKSGDGYYADVMINERVAKGHKDGGLLLEWVGNAEKYKAEGGDKPSNIHMSTGLLLERKQQQGNSKGKNYSWVATNQSYDHLAILFHEQGAGGDKVSIAVNCDQVINSTLPEVNEDALKDSYGEMREKLNAAIKERYATADSYAFVEDFDNEAVVICTPTRMFKVRYSLEDGNPILGEEVGDVITKTEYEMKTNRLKDWFKSLVQWNSKQTEPVQAIKTEEQDMTPEEVQAIVDKALGAVNQKLESVQAENETLKGEVAAAKTAISANADAALAAKREIVKAKLGEVIANSLTGEALDDAVARCSTAASLAAGFQGNQDEADELEGYSINSHAQEAK